MEGNQRTDGGIGIGRRSGRGDGRRRSGQEGVVSGSQSIRRHEQPRRPLSRPFACRCERQRLLGTHTIVQVCMRFTT